MVTQKNKFFLRFFFSAIFLFCITYIRVGLASSALAGQVGRRVMGSGNLQMAIERSAGKRVYHSLGDLARGQGKDLKPPGRLASFFMRPGVVKFLGVTGIGGTIYDMTKTRKAELGLQQAELGLQQTELDLQQAKDALLQQAATISQLTDRSIVLRNALLGAGALAAAYGAKKFKNYWDARAQKKRLEEEADRR